MKFKIAMGLVLAGLCVHSYADLVVVGKNQANTNSAQPTSSNNSSKLPKNKPYKSTLIGAFIIGRLSTGFRFG